MMRYAWVMGVALALLAASRSASGANNAAAGPALLTNAPPAFGMASTTNVADIRLVGVSFYADTRPNQAPGPQYFSTFVGIRNLRSN